jgi:hypothetical protein
MMKRASISLASLPLFLLIACGGNVQSQGTGAAAGSTTTSSGSTMSSTGGPGSTSGTGASTSGTTGVGGSTSTGTSGVGGSTSSATTSGAGGGACMGTVALAVGTGVPDLLTSDCATDTWNPGMAHTPVGYLLEGGPPPGASNLDGYGCASGAASSKGLSFIAPDVKAPGTFTNGTATYTDDQGNVWTNTNGGFSITITKLGAVGDTIDGIVTATVTHPPSGLAQNVSAKFTLCHINDEDVP